MNATKVGVGKPGWWSRNKTNGVSLSLLVALFLALTLINDTNVLHNVIVSKDSFNSVLVYVLLGSWVGVLANFISNRVAGQKIEATFVGERFHSVRFQSLALGAGFFAVLYTASYLIVAGDGDPSILIALSNFSVIYLSIYGHVKSKIPLKATLVPALLILIGAGFTGVEHLGGGLQITIRGLLIMILVSSLAEAVSRIFEGKALEDKTVSAVNLAFWRFLYLAVFGTIFAFGISAIRGSLTEFTNLLGNTWLRALPWIALTMMLAYGSNTLRIVAQKYKELEIVAIYKTAQAAMAVPLTLGIALIFGSGLFTLPDDPRVWMLRLLGTAIICVGLAVCYKCNESGK